MIICLLYASDILSDFKTCFWSLIPKNCGNICHNVTLFDVTPTCVLSLEPCLQFNLLNVAAKAGIDVRLILKDSDMDSKNLSSLIRLSVSDGQKTDSSKVVSVKGI